MNLNIHQIYFEPKQAQEIAYTPYYNKRPEQPDPSYMFLESRVISELVNRNEHKKGDLFGVLGHKFQRKLEKSKHWPRVIHNTSTKKWNKERFEKFCGDFFKEGYDVFSLNTHMKHSTFGHCEQYHPNICNIAQQILDKIDYDIDVKAVNQRVVYFNYFLARPEIYEQYVKELLEPAINVMLEDEYINALCWKNSKYPKKFPKSLAKLYRVKHWPYFPFITERLITIFLSKYSEIKFVSW